MSGTFYRSKLNIYIDNIELSPVRGKSDNVCYQRSIACCVPIRNTQSRVWQESVSFLRRFKFILRMNIENETWRLSFPICINATMSVIAYYVTVYLVPKIKAMFIRANLYGIDMSKRSNDKV